MGGVVGVIAQVAMPLVSKILGGGLGDMLGKLFNFGDMFKDLGGDTEARADDTKQKAQDTVRQAEEARQKAAQFAQNPDEEQHPTPTFQV